MTLRLNYVTESSASVTSTSPCLVALMFPSGSVGKGLCLFVLSFSTQHQFGVQSVIS